MQKLRHSSLITFEPPREKTNNLHRRKQRRRSASRCFRYSDSTIPPLLNSKISSFWLFSSTVQVDLCWTCSETTLLVFPRGSRLGPINVHDQAFSSNLGSAVVQKSDQTPDEVISVSNWSGTELGP